MCDRIVMPNGTVAIVCGRNHGRQPARRCSLCRKAAVALCDAPVRPGGRWKDEDGKGRCSAPLCRDHATASPGDTHRCPDHLEDVMPTRVAVSAPCAMCGASILVARTEAGKKMPLDPVPDPKGNCVFNDAGKVHVLKKAELATHQGERYLPHFATCGKGARHTFQVAPEGAAELWGSLCSRGFTLRLNGAGQLLVSPASQLTEADREAIAANRTGLVEVVKRQAADDSLDWAGAAERAKVTEAIRSAPPGPMPAPLPEVDPERLYRSYQYALVMEGYPGSSLTWSQQPESVRNVYRRLADLLDGRHRVPEGYGNAQAT